MLENLLVTCRSWTRSAFMGMAGLLLICQGAAAGIDDLSERMLLSASIPVEASIVTGKVVDAEGNPIPGAAILIKGTSRGTSTDIDGKFNLEVPDGGVIVVSFLGFITREIAVGNQTELEITLTEDILTSAMRHPI